MSLLVRAVEGRTNGVVFLLASALMFSGVLPYAVAEGVTWGAVIGHVGDGARDHGRGAVLRGILSFGTVLGVLVATALLFMTWAVPGGTPRKACLVAGLFLAVQTVVLVASASSYSKAFAEAARKQTESPRPD